jgi:hypothetical protein
MACCLVNSSSFAANALSTCAVSDLLNALICLLMFAADYAGPTPIPGRHQTFGRHFPQESVCKSKSRFTLPKASSLLALMSPWCRCRIGRQTGSHGRLLASVARRVGVNAGLGAGRRLYWVGVMRCKPKACRILLTEKDRETKLLSDRPRWGYGPWWYGHKK